MLRYGARSFREIGPRLFLALGMALVLSAGCSQSASQANKQLDNLSTDKTAGAENSASSEQNADELRERLNDAIAGARSRRMDPKVNNAWQIVHGILCFGRDLQITVDGKPTPALPWLLNGGELKGWVLVPGEKGLKDVEEPGSKSGEGHDDQWLGYLSQCGMTLDDEIKVKDETFKVSDLVTQAQWDVHEGMEATWTVMAFSKYLPLDAKWTARDGQEWTIERLVGMEAAQDLNGSACGGSHRLYGITCALNRYISEGGEAVHKQLEAGKAPAGWQAGYDKVLESIAKAHEYQQPDGGFSTNFFSRSGSSPDIALRINSTGHTFEFLVMALPDEELKADWMKRAALFLCDLLDATMDQDLECGGLYHAVHGLILYRDRLYGAAPAATANASSASGATAATPAGSPSAINQ
jgi:hypothetical protein